jgi:hypothetical protein
MSEKQCSELFETIFDSHGGGCRRECACGRTHFDISDNGWDWEDGELEGLQAKAKEQPDKYIEHDGIVGCMEICGAVIVYDCKCGLALAHERFLVVDAERIAKYLNERAKRLREKADKMEVKPI